MQEGKEKKIKSHSEKDESSEDKDEELKKEIIYEIDRLSRQGYCPAKQLDIKSDYDEILFECNRLEEEEKRNMKKKERQELNVSIGNLKQGISTGLNILMDKTKDSDLQDFIHATKCISEEFSVEKFNLTDYSKNIFKQEIIQSVCSGLTTFMSIKLGVNCTYEPKIHKETVCLICNHFFQEQDLCRTPDCKHLFHAKCISQFKKCPVCQTLIVPKY